MLRPTRFVDHWRKPPGVRRDTGPAWRTARASRRTDSRSQWWCAVRPRAVHGIAGSTGYAKAGARADGRATSGNRADGDYPAAGMESYTPAGSARRHLLGRAIDDHAAGDCREGSL